MHLVHSGGTVKSVEFLCLEFPRQQASLRCPINDPRTVSLKTGLMQGNYKWRAWRLHTPELEALRSQWKYVKKENDMRLREMMKPNG